MPRDIEVMMLATNTGAQSLRNETAVRDGIYFSTAAETVFFDIPTSASARERNSHPTAYGDQR